MNKYLVVLKGENKLFATREFESLWDIYFNQKITLKQLQNTLYFFESEFLLDSNCILLKRLTFTNIISLVLYEDETLVNLLNSIQYEKISFSDNFTFSVISKFFSEQKEENKVLAKPIWDNLKNPKVNLKNPDYIFNYFGVDLNENKSLFFLSKQLYENNKDYLLRMPKLRPIKRPYTLKADMARAAINLLGLKEGEVLLDPFCGIGGILLEGYDMSLDIKGNDISKVDLDLLKENFEFFYPNAKYELTQFDCSKEFGEENSVDGIVTDIPYGRACRKLGDNLYEEFFKNAKRLLKPNKKMVIIYANFNSAKDLALKYFNENVEITEYINKSMTRHILVLINNKD